MSEEKNNKIFDEFPKVDCNECERYWINQCDGIQKGNQKLCKSFLATRKVNILQELEEIKEGLTDNRRSCVVLYIIMILQNILLLLVMGGHGA